MCNVILYSYENKREMSNVKLYVLTYIRPKQNVKSFGSWIFWNTTVVPFPRHIFPLSR